MPTLQFRNLPIWKVTCDLTRFSRSLPLLTFPEHPVSSMSVCLCGVLTGGGGGPRDMLQAAHH